MEGSLQKAYLWGQEVCNGHEMEMVVGVGVPFVVCSCRHNHNNKDDFQEMWMVRR